MLKCRDEASALLSKFKGMLHSTGEEAGHTKAAIAGIGIIGIAVAGIAAKVGEDSLKAYSTFQSAAASMQGQANMTSKAATDMSNAFLSGFQGMEFSSTQAMQAFAPVAGTFELLSGHALTAGQAVSAMKVAMELADATGETLTQTTSDLSSVLVGTGGKASDSAKDMNSLFNISRMTGVGIDQLSTMINRLRPTLAGSGIGMQQLGGIMIEMVKHFGVGRKTISLAGQMIQHLVTPTSSAGQVMETLNIHTTTATGKFVGFAQALRATKVGLDQNYTAAQRAALIVEFYGTKATAQEENVSNATLRGLAAQKLFSASTAAQAAVMMGNTKQLGAYGAAANKAGVMQKAAADQAATMHGQMEILHASVHDMTTAIGAALAPVVEKLAKLIVPVITRVSEWAAKHKTLAAIILGSMFVFGLLIAVGAGVALAMTAWGGATAFAAGATAALDTALGILLSPVVAIIAAVIAIGVAIYELVVHFAAVIHAAEWLGKELYSLGKRFVEWVAQTKVVKEATAYIVKTWHQVYDYTRTIVTDIVNWLRNAWQKVRVQAEEFWTQVKNTLIAIWTDIANAANAAWQGFVGFFQGIWQDVQNDAISAWDWLKGFPAELWGWFKDGMNAAWSAISGLASTIWGWFSTAWDAAWGALKTAGTTLWGWFKDGFDAAWGAISGLASTVWGWFKTAWDTAWGVLKTVGTTLYGWFKDGFDAAWGAVSDLAKSAWSTFSSAWNAVWDALKTAGTTIYGWFKTGFTSAWAAVSSFAKTYGGDAITGLWNGMKSIWAKAEAWLGDMDGMVKQYFKDAGSWLESIGESIMQGLWDGLKSKFEDVKSWLSGVGNTIASLKGPVEKDRVLLTTQGQAIIQGLQAGMQAKMPALMTMVSGIAPQITNTVTNTSTLGAGAMPLVGGAGGQTTSLTVDMRGATFLNTNQQNAILNQISSHFARFVVPSSGLRMVSR